MSPKNSRLNIETFERFMLVQDTPTQSNTFVLTLGIEGKIDRVRLQHAISQTESQHPLTTAKIDTAGCHWDIAAQAPRLLDAFNRNESIQFDLHSEYGLRIALCDQGPNSQQLVFIVHHACLDALGALQFIADLAANYTDPQRASIADESATASIVYLQKYRRSYGGNRILHALRWPLDLLGMLWSYEMIFNRPTAIQQPVAQDAPDSDNTAMPRATRTKSLDDRQLVQAREIAKSNRQTLNDHLLSSSFMAIKNWCDEFNTASSPALVRLMVPISLRRGDIVSASNMVAMVNLDRTPAKLRTVRSFRRFLSLEMKIIKRIRAGITANRFLALEHKIFGRWRVLENNTRCLATCVVSNMGDISTRIGKPVDGRIHFGDATVQSIDVIGPIRPHTNVCIHALTYLGRFQLVATYNSNKLTPEQADFLLDNVVTNLLQE